MAQGRHWATAAPLEAAGAFLANCLKTEELTVAPKR